MKNLKDAKLNHWIAIPITCLVLLGLAAKSISAATLSNAVRNGDQFQFTVMGETNAMYIIEVSTNFQQWRVVNNELAAVRLITLNASDWHGFYRVRNGLFAVALAAKGYINLNGNNLSTVVATLNFILMRISSASAGRIELSED